MGKFIDLTGNKYGMWTVMEKTDTRDASGAVKWKCKCECGTIREISGSDLRKGKSTCCGCIKRNGFKDISGQRFNKLIAIKPSSKRSSQGHIVWECKCDCGNICKRSLANLTRKDEFHSCGCYNKELLLNSVSKELKGEKIGKLLVLEKTNLRSSRKGIIWKCQCDCGNICYVDTNSLTTKNTQSCGCITSSIGEYNIEQILIQNKIKYKKEYTEPSLNKKRFDFALLDENNKIYRLIEFDGEQHFTYRKGLWNSKETLSDIQQRDKEKNNWTLERKIPLIRIPYTKRNSITLEMLLEDKYLIKE